MTTKIALNHPESTPFVEAVGKLILNLGMIEYQTNKWISVLQTDPMVLQVAQRSRLKDRVDIVRKMIPRLEHVTQKDQLALDDLWSSVLPHLEVRNVVAHNCVIMNFQNEDLTQPSIIQGVMNMKPRDKTKQAELISVAEINGSVNETARIANALFEATKQLASPPEEKAI